ncbi:MAG: hypothetical protein HFH91_18255 [Lachnospiraceae bacterium]|nr:hypothetical protein [Lachnospiraceae bacterium]
MRSQKVHKAGHGGSKGGNCNIGVRKYAIRVEVPEEQKPEGGNGGGTGKAGAERRQWGGTGRAGAERQQWGRNRKSRSRKAATRMEKSEKAVPRRQIQGTAFHKFPAVDTYASF